MNISRLLHSRWTWLIIACVVVAVGIVLIIKANTLDKKDGCYTVAEVWKNASSLRGEKICVQGKAEATRSITLVLCCPYTCGCNETFGDLKLVSEDQTVYNPKVSIIDYIQIQGVKCSGDECRMTCSPIDPSAADYYQFYGELSTKDWKGEIGMLALINIDYSASRQLVDGVWQPIPTGEFVENYPTPDPNPKECENR